MNADPQGIFGAVQQGLLSEADLDRALHRLFVARFRLGLLDPPSAVPYSRLSAADNGTEAHRQLALRMARESLVLLKNKSNFLPLKHPPATIAVIGPDADSLDALEGNYSGTPSKPVTILAGIRNRFPQSRVVLVQGTGLVGPVTKSIPASALCPDASCNEHGLKADYFPNMMLEGSPVMSRVDAAVDFAWGDTGITPQLPNKYSVRWTGVLVPPESGDYLLGFTGEDGFRAWLDGALIVVSVDVTNTGSFPGDEVVELYLTHLGVRGAPLRALKGFTRVHFERGERKTVKFVLRDRDLSIVDESGKHRIVPGKVEAWIGGGQPAATARRLRPAGAAAQFRITGEAALPD